MSTPTLSTLAALAIVIIGVSGGCERSTTGLEPWPLPTNNDVFLDALSPGTDYQAFLGSKLDAVSVDANDRAVGTASLKVLVPAPGNPAATYAGGAITTRETRNLSGYNAVAFYAKASVASTLDVAGFGNDNTGASLYTAEWRNVGLTTAWKRFVIPIPQPNRLQNEGGLFFFAEGDETGSGQTLWFDDIKFVNEPGISVVSAVMADRTVSGYVGGTVEIRGTQTTFNVGGQQRTIGHMPAYFDYTSTDPSVAVVGNGGVRLIGQGQATIAAKLGSVDVTGQVNVTVTARPTVPAPTPTDDPANVISLFSDAYTDVDVASWSATWDQADVSDLTIQGNAIKAYVMTGFAGIEWGVTADKTIDATDMTHFHIDVWVPEGTNFLVKLVDFGPDGVYGFAPDSERELTFNASTVPPFTAGEWVSLDIPLESFMFGPRGLFERAHLAQLILSGVGTAYIDNVYFHK